MSLKRITPNPRFTRHLIAQNHFANNPFRVIDVGAAQGIEPRWQLLGNQIDMIGFEPQETEYAKIKDGPFGRIFPVALGKKKKKRTFHITKWVLSSGFMRTNEKFTDRIPSGEVMGTEKEVKIDSVPLKDFCADNAIDYIDYLKLDTEGTELEIAESGEEILRDTCLAVESEVSFFEYNIGRPLMGDFDVYMRKLGFYMFDIELSRYPRKALPPLEQPFVIAGDYGPPLIAQVLYVRDPIHDLIENNPTGFDWTSDRVLKTIALYEMHQLQDCAIELLEFGVKEGLVPLEFERLVDLITPPVFGRPMPLSFRRQVYAALPQIRGLSGTSFQWSR